MGGVSLAPLDGFESVHRGRPLPILRVVGTKTPREHAAVMAKAEFVAGVRPFAGDTCREIFSSGGRVTHEGPFCLDTGRG